MVFLVLKCIYFSMISTFILTPLQLQLLQLVRTDIKHYGFSDWYDWSLVVPLFSSENKKIHWVLGCYLKSLSTVKIGCTGCDLVVFGVFSVFLGVSAVWIFDVMVARVLNFASVSASAAQLYMLLSERERLWLVSLVVPEM